MRALIVLVVLMCATCRVAFCFVDGLLPNGNFELAPKPSDLNGTVVLKHTAIPEWETSGFVEYIKAGQKQGDMLLVVPEGAAAVRLGNEASIKQRMPVTKGMYYSLTFSAARTCAQEETLNVSVAPDFGVLPMQTLYSSNGWDSYAWAFQAEVPVAEIVIHNPGVSEDPACGPLIDSIAIRALYPPRLTKLNILKNMDHRRFIHCGDVAGTSSSRLEGASSSGYPSTSGYPPGTNACGGGVPVGIELVNNNGDPSSSVKHSPPGKGKAPHEEGAGNPSTSGYPAGTHASGRGVPVGIELVDNNGDPSSSVKHSPLGKGKVPHEEGAGRFADVSGDAIGSMNASREGDLEMGLVNSNADPSALGDVRSSVVHHVDLTAAGSGVYGENVAMTIFQVATAAYGTATSKFAQASHTTSLATSMAAFLLADTNWKAATPILTKVGSVVCGVGVLADIGKDLPLPLFLVAISTALLIIIVAILFAKRPT